MAILTPSTPYSTPNSTPTLASFSTSPPAEPLILGFRTSVRKQLAGKDSLREKETENSVQWKQYEKESERKKENKKSEKEGEQSNGEKSQLRKITKIGKKIGRSPRGKTVNLDERSNDIERIEFEFNDKTRDKINNGENESQKELQVNPSSRLETSQDINTLQFISIQSQSDTITSISKHPTSSPREKSPRITTLSPPPKKITFPSDSVTSSLSPVSPRVVSPISTPQEPSLTSISSCPDVPSSPDSRTNSNNTETNIQLKVFRKRATSPANFDRSCSPPKPPKVRWQATDQNNMDARSRTPEINRNEEPKLPWRPVELKVTGKSSSYNHLATSLKRGPQNSISEREVNEYNFFFKIHFYIFELAHSILEFFFLNIFFEYFF
jgi:hypothetical protein